MKYIVSLCLAIALVSVNAYDFDDSAFNEYLFNELQSQSEDSTAEIGLTHRSRRDTEAEAGCPRTYKKEMHCCKGGNVDREQLKAFSKVKKECLAEIRKDEVGDFFDPFNCEVMNKVKEQVVCMSECIAKKKESIDENGDMKRDLIVELLRTQIGDAQWKLDAVEGYVDKCIAEVKEIREQRKSAGITTEGCSRDPLAFQRCMWREFWNGCPADLRVDTPKCNKLREHTAEGDLGFFGKHFLHKYYLEDK